MRRILFAAAVIGPLAWLLTGCAMSGGVLYSAEVYTCPTALLESVNEKLEVLCPKPEPSPQPTSR